MPDRTKKKPLQPLKRKIHFADNEVWTYELGSSGVKIRTPDCKETYFVQLNKLIGLSWDAIERAHWHGSDSANATPSDVSRYILEHLKAKVNNG
jgi:hypothetical protein